MIIIVNIINTVVHLLIYLKKILIAGTERFTKGTNCVINLLHMYSYIRKLLRILSIITFKWVKKISMVTQHACVKSWE